MSYFVEVYLDDRLSWCVGPFADRAEAQSRSDVIVAAHNRSATYDDGSGSLVAFREGLRECHTWIKERT